MLRPLRRYRSSSVVAVTVRALACAVALALSASQAQGAAGKAALSCGAHVTSSVTLTANIGPCPPTSDGLDIVASNITVNLNGHSITGSNSTNFTKSEPVGIGLMNVHEVTVTGPGTIQHFDAGISVNGGSSNRITNLTVKNNVAHVVITGGVDQNNLLETPCDNGDGILTNNSNYNVISNVVATGNGPFDGIALVGLSSYNQVLNSNSFNNDVSNLIQTGPNEGNNGPCGPFSAVGVGIGRAHQDIGIRIEGPGATHNIVAGNTATGNQLEGISIHGNVCPGNPGAGPPNTNNLVKNNLVTNNGFAGPMEHLDGIGVLRQGPPGVVCVAFNNSIIGNTSNSNARDGIYMGGRGSHGNIVSNNTTNYNGRDGIDVEGPMSGLPGSINNVLSNNEGHGNGSYDGFDGNPGCDNNKWTNNVFTTFNPPCVMGL